MIVFIVTQVLTGKMLRIYSTEDAADNYAATRTDAYVTTYKVDDE